MINKKHKITAKMLASWFNYSSSASFRNSSAYNDMISGINKLIKHVECKHLLTEIQIGTEGETRLSKITLSNSSANRNK